MATRNCPYCAEEIQPEAIICRFCRSRLNVMDAATWRRDHADRRLAGVAAAVAYGLAVPLRVVRLGFVALTFVHFVGPLAYAGLWALIPPRVGEPSVLDRLFDTLRGLFESLFGSPPPSGGTTTPHVVPGDPRA